VSDPNYKATDPFYVTTKRGLKLFTLNEELFWACSEIQKLDYKKLNIL